MYFNIIASGSKGNATLVVEKDTIILIDMGVTLTRLEAGLSEIGKKVSDITGAIITHDHSDHTAGIKFLPKNKIYALEGTITGTGSHIVKINEPFLVGEITITPIKISHDAINPCGFVLEFGNEKLSYITDTGYVLNETLPILKNPSYLIIESNHDIKMLLKTNRPMELKQRILSDHGHLCNEDSAIATCGIIGPNTKEVVLAHISEEANTPEMALEAYRKILNYFSIDTDSFVLKVACQWKSLLGGNYEN